jgi:hypothetical protein
VRNPEDLKIGCTAGGTTHHDHDVPDIATKVRMVKDAGVFDYVDRCPPDDEFRELLKASERCDLPVLVSCELKLFPPQLSASEGEATSRMDLDTTLLQFQLK